MATEGDKVKKHKRLASVRAIAIQKVSSDSVNPRALIIRSTPFSVTSMHIPTSHCMDCIIDLRCTTTLLATNCDP